VEVAMRNWLVALPLLSLLFMGTYSHADAKTVHTVQKGDTLQKISKRYHVSLPELKSANNLSSTKLSLGDKIVIPEKGKASSVSSESSRKGKMAESAGKKAEQHYTVKKGDSLAKIAKQFNTTPDALKSLNGLHNNKLKLNQKLIVAKKAAPVREAQVEQSEDRAEKLPYDPKTTPVIASAKIQQVKELSRSEEVSDMDVKDRLMLFAKKMLHLPYKFGANGVSGVDCSSYVQKVFGIAGINLPRSAREQFTVGEKVDKKELAVGDLVFFQTYARFPSHVGIYLGNNLFIHASSKTKRVTIDSLEHPYYVSRYIGAKRLLPEEQMETAVDLQNNDIQE